MGQWELPHGYILEHSSLLCMLSKHQIQGEVVSLLPSVMSKVGGLHKRPQEMV